jgi:hypothetical protein
VPRHIGWSILRDPFDYLVRTAALLLPGHRDAWIKASFQGLSTGLPGKGRGWRACAGPLSEGTQQDVVALMTTGLVLLPIAAVGVVLAWAESRARGREAITLAPRLTRALLAARDDEEGLRQRTTMFERMVACP